MYTLPLKQQKASREINRFSNSLPCQRQLSLQVSQEKRDYLFLPVAITCFLWHQQLHWAPPSVPNWHFLAKESTVASFQCYQHKSLA